MKKRIFLMLFILVALVMVLASCGHDCEFTVVKQEQAATCTDTGFRRLGCTECDEEKTEIIPSLGHDYVSTVNAPTCKDQGYTTQKCSRCGDTNSDAKLDIKPATGQHTFVPVPDTGKAATCTEDGYEFEQQCSVCKFKRPGTIVNKLGHKYTEKTNIVTAPTCTDDGVGIITKTCDTCGAKDPDFTDKSNEVIPALGHDIEQTDDYRISTMAATCTTKQHDTWGCKREGCTYTEDADVGEVLGHDYSVEAGIIQEATCYSEEVKKFNCVRYGQPGCIKTAAQGDVSENRATKNSVLPHTPGAAADCDTPQTCATCANNPLATELGTNCEMDNNMCLKCIGTNRIHVFANPTGIHDYDVATDKGLESTVAPTCMRQGYSVYRCTSCDKTYEDNYTDIVADAHNVDYDSLVGGKTVDATCITYEYGVHACTNTDAEGNSCSYETKRYVGNEYADHVFATGEPTGVITCTYCQKSFYDTTYNESVYAEYEDKEFDDNASLDVTITVSKEVADPMKLTDTATSATQVDAVNVDTTKISIIRIISNNEDVKFTVTVNGETVELTGSGYIDLCAIGDITSLSVASEGTGTYEATVYFYGENPVPAE